MKEIALKSILLQILRRKKLFSLLIVIPLLLGMAAGAMRSRSAAPPAPGADRDTEYKYLKKQLDSLVSLRDSHQQVITNSIALNMDPSKVASRRHTFFLDVSSPLDEGTAGRIGNYYSYYKFTAGDYAAMREILGRPELPEIYIDELVSQVYNSDLGLLTLSAVHPEQAVADRLGNYNYDRIQRLYAVNTMKNHDLKLIGQVSAVRTDESVSQRLNDRIAAVSAAQQQIDALRPRLAAMEIVPDLNPGGDLVESILTWGILGLVGGVALALVAAAALAAAGETIHDPKELERTIKTEVLGYLPQARLGMAERLIFGPVRRSDQYERILSRLEMELERKGQGQLTAVLGGAANGEAFLTELERDLPRIKIKRAARLDRPTLFALSPGSLVLLIEDPAQPRSLIEDRLDLLRRSGSDVTGLVFVS